VIHVTHKLSNSAHTGAFLLCTPPMRITRSFGWDDMHAPLIFSRAVPRHSTNKPPTTSSTLRRSVGFRLSTGRNCRKRPRASGHGVSPKPVQNSG
jgi:hypothetical protein